MGRPYLPATRVGPRQTAYPGMAFPEAVRPIGFTPLTPPFDTPMFDIVDVDLYWWFTDWPETSGLGPIVHYRRDWEAPAWCYLPTTPPEEIPFSGYFEYIVHYWPAGLSGIVSYPAPQAILHEFKVHWDTWAATPWYYYALFSTLVGMSSPVGWNMPRYAAGLAITPCTFGAWNSGWEDVDMGTTPWADLDEQMDYASSSPVIFS